MFCYMYQLGDCLRSLPELQQTRIKYELFVHFQTYRTKHPKGNLFLAEDVLYRLHDLLTDAPESVTHITQFVTRNLPIQTHFVETMQTILTKEPLVWQSP